MVTTTNKEVTETKTAGNETLLTPRFYTTDFKEISELIEKEHKAKRLTDFFYKQINDHIIGKY